MLKPAQCYIDHIKAKCAHCGEPVCGVKDDAIKDTVIEMMKGSKHYA